MKLVLISGLSGSGKSTALRTLEDLGYYCIDNLPVLLLYDFAQQMQRRPADTIRNSAVGIDARNLEEDLQQVPSILERLKNDGVECEVLFLTADDDALFKRFSETRRKHPLSGNRYSLADAIESERARLEPIVSCANLVIDTSLTNIHELRELVRERVYGRARNSISLLFQSFGYKHGVPGDADFVFDVRCLPNPYWEPQLRPLNGFDAAVIEYLESQPMVMAMIEDLRGLLERWLPHFEAENRSYVTVGIGCTGGQHRSVYTVEKLAAHFRKLLSGTVLTRHRELK
ncbi:MAG: RNase adapter RapZ [Proteobacteria bacterium]|nr:MAG: RNase adapter RapZ [Pseudomonadota bacterium]QKK11875.1 MAG: RNase adapter RapZ [Pseudomonadota bacterium]